LIIFKTPSVTLTSICSVSSKTVGKLQHFHCYRH
jgi:hypothetical protein